MIKNLWEDQMASLVNALRNLSENELTVIRKSIPRENAKTIEHIAAYMASNWLHLDYYAPNVLKFATKIETYMLNDFIEYARPLCDPDELPYFDRPSFRKALITDGLIYRLWSELMEGVWWLIHMQKKIDSGATKDEINALWDNKLETDELRDYLTYGY